MATEAQMAANRRNAQKSTGPKTAAGKAAVAQNALRHGLCAEQVVVFDERPEDFAAFSAGLHKTLAPADEYEAALVDRMVQLEWRLRRAWRMEAAAIDGEARRIAADRNRAAAHAAMVADSLDHGTRLDVACAAADSTTARWSDERIADYLGAARPEPPSSAMWTDRLGPLARYEAALERQLHRATRALQDYRDRRRAEAQPAAEPTRQPAPRRIAPAAPKLPPPHQAPPAFAMIETTEQSQFVRPPPPLNGAATM